MSVPDFALGTTFRFCFTTRRFSTGAPYTLAGTPALSVKESGNDTPITAGITLDVDTCATPVTGLNEAEIVATSGNGYESGKSYSVYISAGTVDSVSVVGEVVYQFTIEMQSALRPTTAGRTLDVESTGEAGLDFNNIKAASAPTTLTNITVPTVTTLTGHTAQTGDSYAIVNSGTYGNSALKTLIDAVDDYVDTEVAAIKAQTDKLAFTGAGPYEVKADVVDWKGSTAPAMTGDAFARLGAPAGASVSADIAAVKVDTAAILIDTAEIGAAGAGLTALAPAATALTNATWTDAKAAYLDQAISAAGTLTSAERNSVADALLARTLGTESYAADGSVPTVAQMFFMIYACNAQFVISGTDILAKKLDGTTTAMTFGMDSDTTPTYRIRSA